MPQLILYVVLLTVLGLILLAGWVALNGLQSKGRVQKALNLTLLLIKVPREAMSGQAGGGGQPKNEKELIGIAEQLISSFTNLHSKGLDKFLYGEPYLVLEMAVHHIGEETHFYLAVPRNSEGIIEKQIYGFYPSAEIGRVSDYNIFNPAGSAAGSYLTYTQNPILPFKTYQKLEADPIGGILTALSKLETEGEGAAMQILIRPAHANSQKSLAAKVAREMQSGYQFKEALRRAKHPPKPKKPEPGQPPEPEKPRLITPADDEVIKAIAAKAGKQNFDVNIRLLTSAISSERAGQILQDLEGSLTQFSSPDLNGFKTAKLSGSALEKLAYNFAFRLFDERQKMVMSTEEIASFYHFPLATTATPKVKFLKAKQSEPPANLPAEGVVLGASVFRGQEVPIRMADGDRRRHLYVIGQTGTGKSSLMKQMIRQDIANGKGVCLVDPHGEFADYVLSVVPPGRAEEVIHFNPGDIDRPLGLNMLEIDPARPEQKTFVANEMLAIVKALYQDLPEAFGPMFEQYFKNAILLLLDDYATEIPTLAELPKVLANADYRRDKLSRELNPLVKNFWELEAEKAGGEAALVNMVPYITSKLNPFLANDYVRPIIGQQKSAFNFREVIDGGKILIVNLSKGRIGDINANLLGMIIVSKLLMASLSRVDIADENQRRDFYFYIDEFQNFTTESIATILSEARKYRLDLIVAHQYIKQLQENIRDAVFGNVGSMAVFRVGADDAEYLKNQFEPVFSVQDLMSIDNFHCYLKLLINNQTTRPFSIQTSREPDGSAEVREQIRELSRLKYGRPREEVETEIAGRYQV
ncbi:MAG: DUF87 domain-containing protein [Patescibacteria group bacterium]